jgi:uncharacterized membrane-anchored protein YitT (DUF2179 family)
MLNYNSYAYLRYVLLVNIIAALLPAMSVKGRANDPLLHAAWWRVDQHSAVLVVSLAAILGSALVYVVISNGIRRWWVFLGCGIFVGTFPATFYWIAAPIDTNLLFDMYFDGIFCGVVAGVVLHILLKTRKPAAVA